MQTDSTTTLCCIIGNPIEHSLSPLMHNSGYKSLGLDFTYLALEVEDVKAALDGMRTLDVRGMSVTIPYKQTVMEFLDVIDPIAKEIGAVNTIVNENGKLVGSNSDWTGAMKALEEITKLTNKKVVLVGAGGAARAIAYGLKQKGAQVEILNRSIDKAKELAEQTGATYGDLSSLKDIENADILIHATKMGMSPNNNKTIIPKEYLHKNLVVFDIVYTPKETRLLQDAKEAGCKVVYGYKMLLYQAVSQFELFTKITAPVTIMEEALLSQL